MEDFMATIKLFAGNFAPRNWAFCHGQLLPIASYQALFSLLGTTYGGNGQTTFGLPDLRSRVPLGTGRGNGLSEYILGEKRGAETTQLTIQNMPAHTHTAKLAVSSENATEGTATSGSAIATPGALEGRDFKATLGYSNSTPEVALNNDSVTVAQTGGSQPVENRQPSLAMNYIICLQGVYPPRN